MNSGSDFTHMCVPSFIQFNTVCNLLSRARFLQPFDKDSNLNIPTFLESIGTSPAKDLARQIQCHCSHHLPYRTNPMFSSRWRRDPLSNHHSSILFGHLSIMKKVGGEFVSFSAQICTDTITCSWQSAPRTNWE
jgi:hypothetical protein